MELLKKFIRYYAPYKAVFFLDLLCATIISVVDLVYPQLLRSLTGTLFTRDSQTILNALLPIAIGLFLMYLIQSLCKYYVSYQGHMMGANMERDMRQQLFDHYEKLSFSYYDQNNSGQMMSKLVSDLFDIAEFAHHGPENLFISLIKVVGSFVFLFLINWRLAIPMAVLVVCMFVFSLSQNQRMQLTFMDNRRKIGDVNASLQDTLAGIRVVQSFANEDTQNLITGLSISDSRELIQTLSDNQDIIYLGITGENITSEISEKKGIPIGVFVEEVEVDSPAMQVGIQNGDVVIEINGETVETVKGYQQQLKACKAGDTIEIKAMRQGTEGYVEVSFEVTLKAR